MKHWITLALIAVALVSCGGAPIEPMTFPTIVQPTVLAPVGKRVMITGDDGTGGTIDPVNVWAKYTTRDTVVAALHPGTAVTMLRREGNGVLIQTDDGIQGWVTYWFIVGQKKL